MYASKMNDVVILLFLPITNLLLNLSNNAELIGGILPPRTATAEGDEDVDNGQDQEQDEDEEEDM